MCGLKRLPLACFLLHGCAHRALHALQRGASRQITHPIDQVVVAVGQGVRGVDVGTGQDQLAHGRLKIACCMAKNDTQMRSEAV